MESLKLMVPTYRSSWLKGSDIELADFSEPMVPVLVHEAEGVRIVLGTHDHPEYEKPDIQIERRPNGWMIFLNPVCGSDTSGFVVFLDDGRSFVTQGTDRGNTEPIQLVEYVKAVAEVDGVKPSEIECPPTMLVQSN